MSDRLGWRPYYEAVDDNPYLPDFYVDMARWSFHLQVCFLTRRFDHHQQIQSAPHSAIQDRTIYEDVEILDAHQVHLDHLDVVTDHITGHLPSRVATLERQP